MMNKDWFMDYAEHAVRVIDIETRWYELRGWITKNGRHILIGDDEGGGSTSGAGKNVDKSGKSGIIKNRMTTCQYLFSYTVCKECFSQTGITVNEKIFMFVIKICGEILSLFHDLDHVLIWSTFKILIIISQFIRI